MYVGTTLGQVYVSQNAGGNWTNISLGLDGSPVQQIITDPARGSHDAYAVTTTGIFYLKDSILLAQNPTNVQYEWQNITGDIKTLAYTIFGQSYNPATDPNATPYDLATVFNSIAANWNYAIPNNPTDLSQGYHPVLYVAANSGVYMSTDNGQTWGLYPSTTYGAVAPGGDLPHVNVTDLSLSQGDISVATGMPDLAGPDQVFTFNGTLTANSNLVTGLTNTLEPGRRRRPSPAPASRPARRSPPSTRRISTSPSRTTRRPAATTSLTADDPTATPDPDLLLAGTYGEGAFAINLAPMILSGTTQIDPTDTGGVAAGGVPTVTTATPTIDGLSEITGFGNATWVTIMDETPGDSTFGQVIGGFNPAAITAASSANSTDIFGNFAIPVTSAFAANGLKTIEIFATDDAGAKSVPVTISFMLQATNLSHPAPTSAPPAPFLELTPTTPPYTTVNGIPVTNNTSPRSTARRPPGPPSRSPRPGRNSAPPPAPTPP